MIWVLDLMVNFKISDYNNNMKPTDNKKKSRKEVAILSSKRALVITLLAYLLYNYQRYVSSFHNNHNYHSFVYLFIIMAVTLFIIETFTPELYKNIMYGIGWGVGAALLNRILEYK